MNNPRHRARKFVTQSLYQWLLTQEDAKEIARQMREEQGFEKADNEHFEALLFGVMRTADELKAQLTPYLDRPLKEVSPVEHAVLLMGAYELIHHLDIPYRVIINEAVELTKTFGSVEGYKYINGILDKLASQLRPLEVQREQNERSERRPSGTP